MPSRYVLLVWSLALLAPWGLLWARCQSRRRAMLWSSLFALPFGFSEVLFAGRYWTPPTLFDLARRVHLDLESFAFLALAGGVASAAYEGITGRQVPGPRARPKRACWQEVYNAGLAAPALVFPVALVALREPIWAGIVALCAGACARVACRPDLTAKTLVGGLLFGALYWALLVSLAWLQPGYIARVWSGVGVGRRPIVGVPATEWLFGVSFGAYWSGLYDHWRWTFARPAPRILHHGPRRSGDGIAQRWRRYDAATTTRGLVGVEPRLRLGRPGMPWLRPRVVDRRDVRVLDIRVLGLGSPRLGRLGRLGMASPGLRIQLSVPGPDRRHQRATQLARNDHRRRRRPVRT